MRHTSPARYRRVNRAYVGFGGALLDQWADNARATTATNAVMVFPYPPASSRATRSGPTFAKTQAGAPSSWPNGA